MKTTAVTFILAIVTSASLAADPRVHLFEKAGLLYEKGQFEQALDLYGQILSMGYESGELHYNLGNCYFKLGRIGSAILFYEKARRLLPSDDDVQANLELARSKITDEITPMPEFWLISAIRWTAYLLPLAWLLAGILGLAWGVCGALITRLLSRRDMQRRRLARAAVALTLLLAVFAGAATVQYVDTYHRSEAIIMADEVRVVSAPGGGGTDLFSLHEGTKVRVDQQQGEWLEIILADGNVGWIQKDLVELI